MADSDYNLHIEEETLETMLQSLLATVGVVMSDGTGNIYPAVFGDDIPYPILSGSGNPTGSIAAEVGQLYVSTANKKIFRCDSKTALGVTTWNAYGGGGNTTRYTDTDSNGHIIIEEVT